jgi:hypothetical protein
MADHQLPNEDVVTNRRAQLRRWIDDLFGGNQAAFIASTNDGERQVNQGELSGLLKTKSFGEKRARSLELMAHMPRGYLDSAAAPRDAQLGLFPPVVSQPLAGYNVVRVQHGDWPFTSVTRQRLASLKAALGPKPGAEAMRDIDALLDIAVARWERIAAQKKRRSQ